MKVSLSIPKPCHEPWREMQQENTGRFCESCQHTVMDLTTATDADLVRLFTSDARPKCARFDPQQLERVLSNDPPANRVIPTVAFGSLLAMLAPEKAAAQGGPISIPQPQVTEHEQVIHVRMGKAAIRDIEPEVKCTTPITGDTIVVVTPAPIEPLVGAVKATDPPDPPTAPAVITGGLPGNLRLPIGSLIYIDGIPVMTYARVPAPERPFIEGRVVDHETSEALPFVNISIEGTSFGCAADLDGFFRIALPDSLRDRSLSIRLSYWGYEATTYVALPVEVPSEKPEPAPAMVPTPGPRTISGFIKDPATGAPVQGASIRIDRTDVSVTSDANGSFAVRVPDGFSGKAVRVIATAHDSSTYEVTVAVNKLPVSIPMELPAPQDPAPLPAVPKEGLVLTLRQQERPMIMGEMMIIDRSPSSRLTRPLKRLGSWVGGVFQR
jgi:hypothetical protein